MEAHIFFFRSSGILRVEHPAPTLRRWKCELPIDLEKKEQDADGTGGMIVGIRPGERLDQPPGPLRFSVNTHRRQFRFCPSGRFLTTVVTTG